MDKTKFKGWNRVPVLTPRLKSVLTEISPNYIGSMSAILKPDPKHIYNQSRLNKKKRQEISFGSVGDYQFL
ncbi:hypothetical protein Lalb_Chr19g0128371 [Lupinus albus]|uniref:Uncharacterized protein n=1 Tax=Lupinus albus TaxID=3870 RepID=A0A6A4P076_LUPAL|nr:hypothetical protein Lalb_Chr19g0128371 [Lupinus albus]